MCLLCCAGAVACCAARWTLLYQQETALPVRMRAKRKRKKRQNSRSSQLFKEIRRFSPPCSLHACLYIYIYKHICGLLKKKPHTPYACLRLCEVTGRGGVSVFLQQTGLNLAGLHYCLQPYNIDDTTEITTKWEPWRLNVQKNQMNGPSYGRWILTPRSTQIRFTETRRAARARASSYGVI